MKVFQIIKGAGCYEDYHEHVQATYLSKERAENELARLKASVPDCDECPYSSEYQDKPIKTDCPHHKPYKFTISEYYEEDDEDNENVYICKNCIDLYDAPSYRMEEYDVIDDENSDDAIVLEENEVEITDSPDIGKTIKCLVDVPDNIKFYLKVGADGKIYIVKVTTSKKGFNNYGFCIQ